MLVGQTMKANAEITKMCGRPATALKLRPLNLRQPKPAPLSNPLQPKSAPLLNPVPQNQALLLDPLQLSKRLPPPVRANPQSPVAVHIQLTQTVLLILLE